jgi:hypothetical protein
MKTKSEIFLGQLLPYEFRALFFELLLKLWISFGRTGSWLNFPPIVALKHTVEGRFDSFPAFFPLGRFLLVGQMKLLRIQN